VKFFEDIQVGEASEIGSHTFTAEEIKAFAAQFDPQPFHFDEAAGARMMFGGLCASGWHIACVWMRLMIEHRQREDAARVARGEPVAVLGPSPGFRDMRVPNPVHPGDSITYFSEVIATRPSATRLEWGLVTMRNSGSNQDRKPVLSFVSTAFVARRRQQQELH
jgi:acyl dehydratase